MYAHSIVAEGLAFPEGPVWCADGSVIVVEIRAGRITRVHPDGCTSVIATPGGGPNGAAIGPDGALYVCNNGGFGWTDMGDLALPGGAAADYTTGRIERVDLATGKVERLYDSCDGVPLSGPNDIVFDASGRFWFTDLGKHFDGHTTHGGLFYATPDGSRITCAVRGPNLNGVGLSPDGRTVYAAHTQERLLLAFDVIAPGEVAPSPLPALPGRVVTSWPGRVLLDSLAIEADGRVAQATLVEHPGICSVDPATGAHEFFDFPDLLTTNICFGGEDMMDAWVTLSTTGKLARCRWPRPGLRLAHYA
ncbi:SMP-30/gluconolactonase/LRE family protein [Glacieibacterium frigidum]|uniref:SMP-30/gluconolactonase/LRE family protein n=1 Tax=Glacieibacterium frigidum TaxID=2593303 RepID=A0A552UEU4_9SPHN|nr:SMP-30/gluconolactonase/LRE family protein [Glacieibacterium frigidum]TRW16746.1 SMP-30/gluconolactonase/LRE family protein [Glacieibacterium frigidum]